MKKPVKSAKSAAPKPTALRKRAEEIARETAGQSPENIEGLSPKEIQQTLHELRVHQIELDMQNEELRRNQAELEASRSRYFDLYDLAPVGYVTVSEQGLILEANITAAALLGVARNALVKQLLTRFIIKEDQDIYYRHRKELFEASEPQICELRMLKKDGTAFWAHLAATAIQDVKGEALCRIVLSDITGRKQSEEALRQNESRLKTLVDILQHPAGNMQDFLDYALAQAIGLTESKIGYIYHYHEDRREFVLNTWSRDVMAECTVANQQTCYELDKTGMWGEAVRQRRPIIVNDFPVAHPLKKGYPAGHVQLLKFMTVPIFKGGSIVGVVGLANKETDYQETDILQVSLLMEAVWKVTERKQAEDGLRESEEKYRNLFENAIEGIFVAQDGHLVFLNPMTLILLGYSSGELSSRSFIDFIHPDDRDMVMDRHIRRLKGEDIPRRYSFRIIHKDGNIRWVELDTVLIKWNGKPATLNFLTDITDRKQAEDALRESEARLARAEKVAKSGNWKLLLNTKEFTGSQGAKIIYGVESDTISFDDARKCTLPEYIDILNKALTDLITKDIPYSLDIKICRPTDGKILDVHSIAEYDKEKNVVYGIIQDITDRKQAEEERKILEERLNRAEKMEAIGILAGGVAHDLNNVLGIVVGYAEMLLMEADKTSSIRPQLVNIMNGGQRAAAIVDDLLTLARRGVSGREVLNLNKLIADCQKSPELEKLFSYHYSVRVKANLDPQLLSVSGSSVHLVKTFYNLVSNAAEAMPKGGSLTIKTANQYLSKPIQGYDEVQEGEYVVLSVSDTGEGISAANLKRIFEPFYTKKVMGRSGTGLGLAVVWGTVKDHNGYINVQSEEGKGSTFTLYFPVTREDMPPEAVAVAVSEYMGKGESILVVDDVKEQRDLAAGMLRTLNYSVTSVPSGEDAIAYLKEHQADLIVLDMIMDPGMDGLDAYKSILEIHPRQKVIIVSGFSESDRVNAAHDLGAGAYVKKPYVIEKLGLAVKKELERGIG